MSNQHRIVSSESEELILVDEQDNVVGYRSKAACHDGGGVLHRAFSLFLFDDEGQLLLQKRGVDKRLWPGYWSNSCCSHPRRGETLEVATKRRLQDELNTSANLQHVYHFCYQADFQERGAEHELCHVFLGRLTGPVQPNDKEIESIRFVSRAELNAELVDRPDVFTPWFQKEWQALNLSHSDALLRYAD